MRRRGAACAVPFRPKRRTRAAVDDQRTAARGHLEGQRRGMGIAGGAADWRAGRIQDQRGSARADPCEPHRKPFARRRFNARRRERVIEPPLQTPRAAMKPRQSPIRMAQRAQRGRDPRDRREMGGLRRPPRFSQSRRGPCQQRKDFEKLFGVARRDTAISINLGFAFLRQGMRRRASELLHSRQGQTSVDQPRQRLKARQSGRGRSPAP